MIIHLYRSTPLEIKRLEVLRTSIYVSKLSEGINGRQAITTCDRVQDFVIGLRRIVDESNSIHFASFAARAWMVVRQDIFACILTIVVGILVLAKRYEIHPGIGIYLIAFCSEITVYLQITIHSLSELQRGMNGVERLTEYAHLPSEGTRVVEGFRDKHPTWPERGQIAITGASMRYRPELPLALNNLTLSIKAGEKVGIVGRTGAGKSSVLAMLLRTVELAKGRVTIDGIDTRSIGIHELRRQISVIPQDPTLFQGTLRFNLNPTGNISDNILTSALQDVALITTAGSAESMHSQPQAHSRSRRDISLDSLVQTEGANFCSGDRQLIALARALVRASQIILIDEATSNVDPRSDAQIQHTLRHHPSMRCKTVIAIAHRVRTVLAYDRIVVMDKGAVVELGAPQELWRRGGRWRALCDKSRVVEADFED